MFRFLHFLNRFRISGGYVCKGCHSCKIKILKVSYTQHTRFCSIKWRRPSSSPVSSNWLSIISWCVSIWCSKNGNVRIDWVNEFTVVRNMMHPNRRNMNSNRVEWIFGLKLTGMPKKQRIPSIAIRMLVHFGCVPSNCCVKYTARVDTKHVTISIVQAAKFEQILKNFFQISIGGLFWTHIVSLSW